MKEIPAIVRDMADDEAVIFMVDSIFNVRKYCRVREPSIQNEA
jgi:hypothetical protein